MKRDQYKAYLKTNHWKKFSGLAKYKDKSCKICGSSKQLNVHHLSYQYIGHEKLEQVLVLCQSCHYKLHDTGWGPREIKEKVKQKTSTMIQIMQIYRKSMHHKGQPSYQGYRQRLQKMITSFEESGNVAKHEARQIEQIKKRLFHG